MKLLKVIRNDTWIKRVFFWIRDCNLLAVALPIWGKLDVFSTANELPLIFAFDWTRNLRWIHLFFGFVFPYFDYPNTLYALIPHTRQVTWTNPKRKYERIWATKHGNKSKGVWKSDGGRMWTSAKVLFCRNNDKFLCKLTIFNNDSKLHNTHVSFRGTLWGREQGSERGTHIIISGCAQIDNTVYIKFEFEHRSRCELNGMKSNRSGWMSWAAQTALECWFLT